MNETFSVQVKTGAFILAAALLLILPIQWFFAAILAAFVHECFHAGAVLLLGGRIEGVEINIRGIMMRSEILSAPREMICALAGPLGSFLLLLTARWLPRTAVCGLVHGIYNLLPLLPLDGGRVVRSLFYTVLPPPAANRCFLWFQRICLLILLGGCLLLVSRIGFLPILLVIFILRGHRREKALALKPVWQYNGGRKSKGER